LAVDVKFKKNQKPSTIDAISVIELGVS